MRWYCGQEPLRVMVVEDQDRPGVKSFLGQIDHCRAWMHRCHGFLVEILGKDIRMGKTTNVSMVHRRRAVDSCSLLSGYDPSLVFL